MTPGEAPPETLRLLADLDLQAQDVGQVEVEALPVRTNRRPTSRQPDKRLDADLADILRDTAVPLGAPELAQALGRAKPDLHRRLTSRFVEIGKGSWWSPDKPLPEGVSEVVTLPRNVRERVRAEAAIGSPGRNVFVRRRP